MLVSTISSCESEAASESGFLFRFCQYFFLFVRSSAAIEIFGESELGKHFDHFLFISFPGYFVLFLFLSILISVSPKGKTSPEIYSASNHVEICSRSRYVQWKTTLFYSTKSAYLSTERKLSIISWQLSSMNTVYSSKSTECRGIQMNDVFGLRHCTKMNAVSMKKETTIIQKNI